MTTGIDLLDYAIEGNDKPLSDAAALLRWAPGRFDVVVAQKGMLKAQWPKIRAANGELYWAVYSNGSHTTNGPPYFPPDWYLWDEQGRPVKAAGDWTQNFLMNPLSEWQKFKEEAARSLLLESGANALYVDECGVGNVYSVSAPPLDPRTSLPWTWADYMVEMDAALEGYRNAIGATTLYCNGLGNGNRYFNAPTSTLLDHSDGALAESFLRGASQPATFYPTAANYDREVRMIEDAGATCWACTKVWTGDTATRNRVLRWALGSFLLGAAPGATWYSTAIRATTVTPWRTEWMTAKRLGAPLGPRDGLTRSFEYGTVTVNNVTHDASLLLG